MAAHAYWEHNVTTKEGFNDLYVGQTVNDPRTRCASHRSWMKKRKKKEEDENEPERFRRKDEGALAEHLKVVHGLTTVEDFNRSYKFTILKSNVSNLDSVEQSWNPSKLPWMTSS